MLVSLILLLSPVESWAKPFDWTDWNKVLSQFVTLEGAASKVDYSNLKANKSLLNAASDAMSEVKENDFATWTKNEQLAFLINAYNAFTLRLIVDNDPVDSIRDLGGFLSSPWKKKFFPLFSEKRSLDWVEHTKIRGEFSEPRIHFAVNCASIGCPALLTTAFDAAKLDTQLEAATLLFLNDSSRNYWDDKRGVLFLSQIFEWYGDDFRKNGARLEDFVAERMSVSEVQKAKIRKASIKFLKYDWRLNGK